MDERYYGHAVIIGPAVIGEICDLCSAAVAAYRVDDSCDGDGLIVVCHPCVAAYSILTDEVQS